MIRVCERTFCNLLRTASKGRFSLEGVKAVRSPKNFATLVMPEGFDPVDVRVHPQSLERLVNILGGESLYGRDHFAPIRELLQNARDAILLQNAADEVSNQPTNKGEIHVALRFDPNGDYLNVTDNGVGMTANIITNYLLGVASDYWHSSDFFADFPGVASRSFEPAGRFGIGFLSSFMIGDEVTVQTERRGGQHLTLKLSGLERRGALITGPANGRSGTTVQIKIPHDKLADYEGLDAIVRAKAPLLEFPVVVSQKDGTSTIAPGWWQNTSQEDLYNFVSDHNQVAYRPARELRERSADNPRLRLTAYYETFGSNARLEDLPTFKRWPGQQPEVVSNSFRVLAVPTANEVLLCSKGLAVDKVRMPGLIGLIEVGNLELNAARSQTLKWKEKETFRANLLHALHHQIIETIDGLEIEGLIPARYEFLNRVGQIYGDELLVETKLPWITVIDPPGHAVLVSATELRARTVKTSEVIVSFGVGPWELGAIVHGMYPEANRAALLIPISRAGQPQFGRPRDYDTVVQGSLIEHFRKPDEEMERYRQSEDEEEVHAKATLLMVTLRLIAEAWNLDIQKLLRAQWIRYGRQYVCGHFIREKL